MASHYNNAGLMFFTEKSKGRVLKICGPNAAMLGSHLSGERRKPGK
jgi:hypothetical protein